MLLLHRNIVFRKTEPDYIIIYVHNFFLYFEYDGFLTLFRISVVRLQQIEGHLINLKFYFSRDAHVLGSIFWDMQTGKSIQM